LPSQPADGSTAPGNRFDWCGINTFRMANKSKTYSLVKFSAFAYFLSWAIWSPLYLPRFCITSLPVFIVNNFDLNFTIDICPVNNTCNHVVAGLRLAHADPYSGLFHVLTCIVYRDRAFLEMTYSQPLILPCTFSRSTSWKLSDIVKWLIKTWPNISSI
jgi:hypothetical protein